MSVIRESAKKRQLQMLSGGWIVYAEKRRKKRDNLWSTLSVKKANLKFETIFNIHAYISFFVHTTHILNTARWQIFEFCIHLLFIEHDWYCYLILHNMSLKKYFLKKWSIDWCHKFILFYYCITKFNWVLFSLTCYKIITSNQLIRCFKCMSMELWNKTL